MSRVQIPTLVIRDRERIRELILVDRYMRRCMHACVLLFDGYTGAWNQSLTPTPPVDVQVEPSKSRSSYRLSLLLPSAPHPLHLQMGRANGFLFSGGRGDCACRFVSIPPQQRGPGSHLFPEHSRWWRQRIVPLFLLSGVAESPKTAASG